MIAAIAQAPEEPFRVCSTARPDAVAGQVLVRIHASGVNPLDTKIYAGAAAHARQPLPAILGLDLAGVVDTVGSGVEQFRPGDEVYGMTGGVGGHPGTLAQFAAVDADLLAIKPTNLSIRESAALPLVFTLLPLLTNQGRVHHGEILRNASRLVEAGRIRPHLDPRRYTLDSVGEAYEALTNRTARGRLVVDIVGG